MRHTLQHSHMHWTILGQLTDRHNDLLEEQHYSTAESTMPSHKESTGEASTQHQTYLLHFWVTQPGLHLNMQRCLSAGEINAVIPHCAYSLQLRGFSEECNLSKAVSSLHLPAGKAQSCLIRSTVHATHAASARQTGSQCLAWLIQVCRLSHAEHQH